jgi:ferritin-like metal-binding protein YciE
MLFSARNAGNFDLASRLEGGAGNARRHGTGGMPARFGAGLAVFPMSRCLFQIQIAEEHMMGIFTKDIKTMEDMFLHQLEDIYYAEQQLTKAIPKMAEMATNADLKAGLKSHVIDTKNQIERLDKVFAKLGKQPKGTDCPAIDGLIKEANETAGEIEDKAVLDAAIVANSQAVEHYEISRYGTLIAWAEELGHDDVVRLLTTNLNEEKAANTKLNNVALRKGVNKKASAA